MSLLTTQYQLSSKQNLINSISTQDVINLKDSYEFELNFEEQSYLNTHAKRLVHFTNLTFESIRKISSQKTDEPIKILDIGPHFLTFALHKYLEKNLENHVILNTLGWENRLVPASIINRHFTFDLNYAQHRDKWLPPEQHDVIVMCEVIEHLYTAPELVLEFVKTFLAPEGVLILGTPNAAFLPNRVLLALGKNPFEKIRKTYDDPGHFREYTADEFHIIFQEIGLKCKKIEHKDFYKNRGLAYRILHFMGNLHPPFQKYLSIVCQND